MRRTEIRILDQLRKQPRTVSELAAALNKNQGWISELVSNLEDQHLVTKDEEVKLADTYEARLARELIDTYDLETILSGKKEDILKALLDDSKTISELELDGFATSTIYDALNDLQTAGVVQKANDHYTITDETLRDFLKTRTTTSTDEYSADGETVSKLTREISDGRPTAFSAFTRYGVTYHPNENYRYQGERDLSLEDALIHAVKFAETKKQTGICAVFYLKHSATLDHDRLWELARKWDCVETWADLQAFLDQRDVQQDELFLPWDEFTSLARDYDVYPRGKHPEDSLLNGLTELGNSLDTQIDAYLLGGGNLILRGLKDSTKDLDMVVDDERTLGRLTDTLRELGYEERGDLEQVYEQLNPSIVLERQGFPRWDIFVKVVADQLQLTKSMKRRVDGTRMFGGLNLHLLSLTDIFLFKAITDREGDLEDAALIARQADIDWSQLFGELERQEDEAGRYFSFSVLDTLDLLKERHGIEVPIHQHLISYCLENALLVSLEEPKTIRDLREELDFPDHQIYNKLRKLEDEGEIEVNRSGKLNEYRRTGY